MPAGEVHVTSPHSTGISLRKSKKLGEVIEGSGHFVCLEVAICHGLDQGPASRDWRDKLDVLFGNNALSQQVVTCPIKDVLGRREISECPFLLT